MTERFYCTTCCTDRAMEGSKIVKVKRGNGFAKLRRCAICMERRKGSASERDQRSKEEVAEKRKAAVYVRKTSGRIDGGTLE